MAATLFVFSYDLLPVIWRTCSLTLSYVAWDEQSVLLLLTGRMVRIRECKAYALNSSHPERSVNAAPLYDAHAVLFIFKNKYRFTLVYFLIVSLRKDAYLSKMVHYFSFSLQISVLPFFSPLMSSSCLVRINVYVQWSKIIKYVKMTH